MKEKYGLPHDYLLFVSSLEPRKNISLLIDALAAAKTDIPLVLVGWHGWGEKAWLEKMDTLLQKNRIILTGHVPDQDLKAVYTGAAALVYPSLYEGFGLPLLEAMACGCPVICSNTASMPEVVKDAALLIDPSSSDSLAHAIDTMVHDTRVRTALIQKGFVRAGQFTWEKTARQTIDIFKRVQ
ncbi:MAG: glycosyltransferase family 1 protein [Desulfotignum sp.]|nr:glycosyltransferase family 1 protein [Desulfotignum sp.]